MTLTPLKINKEHYRGGLLQIIFLSKWVICRWTMLIFQGVTNFKHVGVSENSGTPKSSILIGVSIINHLFCGIPIFGNIHVCSKDFKKYSNVISNQYLTTIPKSQFCFAKICADFYQPIPSRKGKHNNYIDLSLGIIFSPASLAYELHIKV